ncbi:MAG: hypothetical protein L0Z62_00635, partial [Gemmataceae bacterium]|nr:hypothetical protein [Gemmataceae bacterium]
MTAILPTWVRKRDGRLVPFDSDRICQALFAATERLDQPDAFLARELTDGVVHFLAEETPGTVAASAWIAEMVAKVVRELRHPDLARAFAHLDQQAVLVRPPGPRPPAVDFRFCPLASPSVVARDCLCAYSLHAVFSRDVAAAHQDGLLTLLGLEEPLGLAAHVVRPDRPDGLTAGLFVLDAPEHDALPSTGFTWPSERCIVNLNLASPPSWAAASAPPPLFAEPHCGGRPP